MYVVFESQITCFNQYSVINFVKHTVIVERKRSSCPEVFCKKRVLRNSVKFTGKHLSQRLFFNEFAANLLKKSLCFPVNFAKLLSTPLFTEHLRWLPLGKGANLSVSYESYTRSSQRKSSLKKLLLKNSQTSQEKNLLSDCFCCASYPWTHNVNLTYIRCSEDVLDVF